MPAAISTGGIHRKWAEEWCLSWTVQAVQLQSDAHFCLKSSDKQSGWRELLEVEISSVVIERVLLTRNVDTKYRVPICLNTFER